MASSKVCFLEPKDKFEICTQFENDEWRAVGMTLFSKLRAGIIVAVVLATSSYAPVKAAGPAGAVESAGASGDARILQGAIDIHVHADPDSHKRYIDYIDAAKLASSRGMRGLVIKNHFEPT